MMIYCFYIFYNNEKCSIIRISRHKLKYYIKEKSRHWNLTNSHLSVIWVQQYENRGESLAFHSTQFMFLGCTYVIGQHSTMWPTCVAILTKTSLQSLFKLDIKTSTSIALSINYSIFLQPLNLFNLENLCLLMNKWGWIKKGYFSIYFELVLGYLSESTSPWIWSTQPWNDL